MICKFIFRDKTNIKGFDELKQVKYKFKKEIKKKLNAKRTLVKYGNPTEITYIGPDIDNLENEVKSIFLKHFVKKEKK